MVSDIPEEHRELLEEWVDHVEDENTTATYGVVSDDA